MFTRAVTSATHPFKWARRVDHEDASPTFRRRLTWFWFCQEPDNGADGGSGINMELAVLLKYEFELDAIPGQRLQNIPKVENSHGGN